MKPKVSVIVPVYNAEKTIERCLDSILNQTLKEIEIIAINDCSTDKSLKILRNYEKKYDNLIVLNNSKNLGPSGSRNRGLKKASGKYIGFVDSDDYIDKNMYMTMASYMDDETDLVTCSRYRNLGDRFKEIINKNETTNPKDLSLISNYTADKLFKKSIIDKYNIKYPEQYRYAEDVYFLTVYRCYCNKMKILKEPFYYIDYNANSITNSYNKNILKIVDVLKDLKKFLEDNNFYEELEEEYLKICCQYYARRVYEFRNFYNFRLKRKFIKKFLNFLEENFEYEKYRDYSSFYWRGSDNHYLGQYILIITYVKGQDKRVKKELKKV